MAVALSQAPAEGIGRFFGGVTPHGCPRRARVSSPYERQQIPFKQRPQMPLVTVVLTLIVIGVLLWLINTYIPMQGAIKSIINIIVVVAVVLWLLYGFGIISHSGDIHLPSFK